MHLNSLSLKLISQCYSNQTNITVTTALHPACVVRIVILKRIIPIKTNVTVTTAQHPAHMVRTSLIKRLIPIKTNVTVTTVQHPGHIVRTSLLKRLIPINTNVIVTTALHPACVVRTSLLTRRRWTYGVLLVYQPKNDLVARNNDGNNDLPLILLRQLQAVCKVDITS